MTREELLALIDTLEPENTQILQALLFLRLVVENNPMKTPEQIEKRPDVQQALKVIQDWVDATEAAIVQIIPVLPAGKGPISTDLGKTLDTLEDEFKVNETNIDQWRQSEVLKEQWGASILLRMTWLVDWLRKTVENLTLGGPYKRWVSRLAENTCKFCRGLHGTVVPSGVSFLPAAKKLGYKHAYGGLFSPPLHPRCRCYLLAMSEAEYEAWRYEQSL